ncbi:MAG: ABC transporter permease [Clostridiales bacterium]|nr:ABC transporter permease [Clostridiales bacterium]MCF8021498.1 ABC transporter permease [Clostridiales bacterium]
MHINYWQIFKQNRVGIYGLAILFAILIFALCGPVFSPYFPQNTTTLTLDPPSLQHWLGTNDVGQDIFTRLLSGARTSLAVAVGTALLSTLLAVLIGITAALAGGITDRILMRFTDALLTIPVIVVVIMIAAYVRPGVLNLIIILSCLGWPVGARVIRAQAMTLKERYHIYAARVFGGGMLYIMFRHIVPDLLPLLCVSFIQGARRAVFMEAGLAFLGVTNPDMISWGMMLRHALEYCYLDAYKWWLLPTGFALSVTILAFSFLGYSLEEMTDPRLRRREDA